MQSIIVKAAKTLFILPVVTLLFAGCSTSSRSNIVSSYSRAAGNWQFTSSSATAARLPALTGDLTVSGTQLSGTFHPLVAPTLCIPVNTLIHVTGAITEPTSTSSRMSLSAPLAGGTLTIAGTLAPNQHSLLNPSYSVTGGACAFPAPNLVIGQAQPNLELSPRDSPSPVIGQQYQPISGTYTGNFSDSDGVILSLTANLSQSSQADSDGNFHIAGNATFPNNPCLNLPVVTDSAVTGSTVSTTYTDQSTGNSITAVGNFNTDATILTITSWTLTGNCGPDRGTGMITKQ